MSLLVSRATAGLFSVIIVTYAVFTSLDQKSKVRSVQVRVKFSENASAPETILVKSGLESKTNLQCYNTNNFTRLSRWTLK